MKTCKYCGGEMEDGQTVCPACGKEDTLQPAAAEPDAQEAPAEEAATELPQEAPAAEEAAPAEEAASEEAAPAEEAASEQPREPERKKGMSGTSAVALAVAAVILVAAIVAVLVMNGKKKDQELNPSAEASESTAETTVETTEATIPADGDPNDVTCKGSYTGTEEEVKAAADTVVATAGDRVLTNGQLQVHYWLAAQNFYSQYGSYAAYFGLDASQPLDTQTCGMVENRTWQQYFLEQALSSWKVYEAIYRSAQENGFQISEELQNELDTIETGLEETAQKNGYGTAEDMIHKNFGPGASVADYKAFWDLYYRSSGYYTEVNASFAPTEQELEEYFNAHEADYAEKGLTKDTHTVDVRHILITPESTPVDGSTTGETTISDEAWADAEAKAKEILSQYLAGDKTEDSFATLANENSQDPGSNTNGGLYTGVSQGQMVEAFDAWCFDDGRQVGDTDIVKTSYGYHVMLYCGSATVWQEQVKSDILTEKTNNFVEEALAANPTTIDYSAIKLGSTQAD